MTPASKILTILEILSVHIIYRQYDQRIVKQMFFHGGTNVAACCKHDDLSIF